MPLSNMLALMFAMFLMAASPGPGVMATVARCFSGGVKPAILLGCGIVTGDLVFLLAAIFGLSYIAEAIGALFVIIKIAGACYLMWIGAKAIFSDGWKQPVFKQQEDGGTKKREYRSSDFLSGLAITLGNPKVIVFYLSFLPTFVDLQHLSKIDVMLTVMIVVTVLSIVLLAYIFATTTAKTFLSSAERNRKYFSKAGGVMLFGSGIFLLGKTS